MPSLHLIAERSYNPLCCLKCNTEDKFLARDYSCARLCWTIMVGKTQTQSNTHTRKTQIAKMMTNTHAAWQRQRCALSVHISQRFSDIKVEERTTKNHNRMWVRVTERQRERGLSVCLWNLSNMEGISIQKRIIWYWYQTYFKYSDTCTSCECIAFLMLHITSTCCNTTDMAAVIAFLHFKHLSLCPSPSPSSSDGCLASLY